jgi:Mrr N-terminal domain
VSQVRDNAYPCGHDERVTDVDVPAYHELLWPTLQAASELGGSASIGEIVEAVVKREAFTEGQQAVLHNDGPNTEIGYRLAWARTYLGGPSCRSILRAGCRDRGNGGAFRRRRGYAGTGVLPWSRIGVSVKRTPSPFYRNTESTPPDTSPGELAEVGPSDRAVSSTSVQRQERPTLGESVTGRPTCATLPPSPLPDDTGLLALRLVEPATAVVVDEDGPDRRVRSSGYLLATIWHEFYALG